MFQGNALLCYSRVTQMLERDVLIMFLDSDLIGIPICPMQT